MKMKKAIKITVKGSVQGVFFRNFVKESADEIGIKGFVRNLSSGGVEIFAEGEIEDVDKLCDLCKSGPQHSVVKDVLIEEQEFQDFGEFKILHI